MPEPGATTPTDTGTSGLDFLHRKLGGVPVWAYAAALAVGAVGVWYFISRRNAAAGQGQTQGQGLTGTTGASASSDFPMAGITYVTGVTQPAPQTDTSSQQSSIQVGPAAGQPNQGPWSQAVAAYSNANLQGSYTLLPFGTYDTAGPSQGGNYPVQVNGATMWVMGENVQAVNGAGGGSGLGGAAGFPTSAVRYGGDNGLATPWEAMHQGGRTPHYWNGSGKGGGLGAAAKDTGLPGERLAHLNPHHQGGMARVA